MFIWVQGHPGTDMEDVYRKAVRRNTAFVPGKFFYTRDGQGLETLRLNYTMSDEASIDKAVKILSEVISE